MYRQVIVIGLGGSGGKTLRFLRRDLMRWLAQNGWDTIPTGWQFLQIDSPTVPDGVEVKVPMLPDSEYLGLVGPGVNFSNVAQQLDGHPLMSEELSTWRVAPAGLGVGITIGAGQYRAIGRTLALAYLQQIRGAIGDVINKVSLPSARAELDRLYHDVNGKPPTTNVGEPLVIVVSSLAGGSGAGLVNDVCDIIREKASWGKPIGILYTPEVFNSIVGQGRNGVQPNSLAAISEILNGYWWHGGSQDGNNSGSSLVPMKMSDAMRAVGASQAINKTGPEYPFLVGAKNSSGVTYTSDNQLFETVGAALLSWLNDEAVQSALVAYAIGNWTQGASAHQPGVDVLVNRGSTLTNEPGMPSFSALGFGRVSVGTKYFETYASELIARDSINHILTYHTQSDEAQQVISRMPYNQVDLEAVVQEIATSQVLNFMKQAGLDEKGPNNNQIVDALRPENAGQILNKVVDFAVSSLSSVSGNLNSADWQRRIEAEVSIAAEEFAREIQAPLDFQITNWIENSPIKLLRVTEEFVAAKGLRVTQSVLKNVGFELVQIKNELAAEEQAFYEESLGTRWNQTISSYLTFGGKVPSNHQSISAACTEAIYQACYGTWARIHSIAQDLIEEFERDVISPLAQQLGDAQTTLENDYTSNCLEWPSWSPSDKTHHGVISPDATPAKSEWTLIKPSEFGSFFDQLLETSKPGLGGLDQRNEVRSSVISGSFIRDLMNDSPRESDALKGDVALSIAQKWWPSSRVSPDPIKNRTPGSFKHSFGVTSIQNRASAWLHTKGTAFEDVLTSTLITFTMANPVTGRNPYFNSADFAKRQQDFTSALGQAMAASDPLVGIDNAVAAALYEIGGNAVNVHRTYSMLPFRGHPIQAQVLGMLSNALGDSNKAEALLDSNGTTEHIDIISWFSGPYPIFLFESLLKPIAENWMMLSGKGRVADRRNFWTRRRARGLGEFIPAPQEHIICMLRGWFTARILGLVDISKEQFSILQPRGHDRNPANFPEHFLSPHEQWGDIPAVILESLGLAFVEVCRRDDLKSLDAYIALRDIGREGDGVGDQLLRYSEVSSLISDWIFEGAVQLESGAQLFQPGLPPAQPGDGPTERKAALLEILEKQLLDGYSKRKADYDRTTSLDPNLRSLTPLWPSLWDQIQTALNQLIEAVRSVEVDTAAKPGW